MSNPFELAKEYLNEPDVTWANVLCSRYQGRMPDSMCEQPYVMTIQIDSVELGDNEMMKLRGHIEYAPNVTLCTMHLFVGEIESASRRFALYETEGKPEDRFTFLGVLSENGRAMSITGYWGRNNHSEEFNLIHESVIGDAMK